MTIHKPMTLQEAKSIARHLGLTLRKVRSGHYRAMGTRAGPATRRRAARRFSNSCRLVSGTCYFSPNICSSLPSTSQDAVPTRRRFAAYGADNPWERCAFFCDTGERIKNLRPLAVMRTNVYRKTLRANQCSARCCRDSLVTLFLRAVAALSLGTLLRWPF